jgi:hypothetical protein
MGMLLGLPASVLPVPAGVENWVGSKRFQKVPNASTPSTRVPVSGPPEVRPLGTGHTPLRRPPGTVRVHSGAAHMWRDRGHGRGVCFEAPARVCVPHALATQRLCAVGVGVHSRHVALASPGRM